MGPAALAVAIGAATATETGMDLPDRERFGGVPGADRAPARRATGNGLAVCRGLAAEGTGGHVRFFASVPGFHPRSEAADQRYRRFLYYPVHFGGRDAPGRTRHPTECIR